MTNRKVIPIPTNAPKPDEVFRHYKGDLYKIVGVALNSWNAQAGKDEWIVVYEPMYEGAAAQLFTRPLIEWSEMVAWEGRQVYRFEKI